jgi:hypothetical protein
MPTWLLCMFTEFDIGFPLYSYRGFAGLFQSDRCTHKTVNHITDRVCFSLQETHKSMRAKLTYKTPFISYITYDSPN